MKQELKVTFLYGLVGILWILISDEIISTFISESDMESMIYFQNVKGIFYIVATGIMLYVLLKKHNDAMNLKINELKKYANELETTNHELAQYINLASHDLQEPSRTVISFLTFLEKKYDNQIDEKGKNYIHFAVEAANKMRQIILDLLEYSKICKNDNLEKVNLNSIIKEIKNQFQDKIKKTNTRITVEDLPTINTDATLIQIIFKNLIDNAIKFKQENKPLSIHIEAIDKKDEWLFKISDNGIGIENEYFTKIFVLFQKLNQKDTTGTGSGLAITKKIVTNLGGTIWVKSVVNKGSDFYIKLPKNEKK
jgi:light-regulated signal transduction histidine kinase (bacteriophytochrome)